MPGFLGDTARVCVFPTFSCGGRANDGACMPCFMGATAWWVRRDLEDVDVVAVHRGGDEQRARAVPLQQEQRRGVRAEVRHDLPRDHVTHHHRAHHLGVAPTR